MIFQNLINFKASRKFFEIKNSCFESQVMVRITHLRQSFKKEICI